MFRPLPIIAIMVALVLSVAHKTANASIISVGSGDDTARVVINFSDGSIFQFDVDFTDTGNFTGLDALTTIESSGIGFDVDSDGFGLVNGLSFDDHSDAGFEIDGSWVYWLKGFGETDWTFSPTAASGRILQNGDADGWVFGPSPGAKHIVPEPSSGMLFIATVAGLMIRRRIS